MIRGDDQPNVYKETEVTFCTHIWMSYILQISRRMASGIDNNSRQGGINRGSYQGSQQV